jgi:GNAT superfamily N-acetyltransferase
MCDDLMPNLKLRLSVEEFHRLPRHPAYTYEYLRGQACLTPRPKHYHALLGLKADALPGLEGAEPDIALRRIEAGDRDDLERLFAAAFERYQPFASLDEKALKEAVRTCLHRTLTGGDGPWIEQASFLAIGGDNKRAVGAVFITLLPEGPADDYDSYYWNCPPPANCIALRLGRPHLTWIFVGPLHADQGIGTALLAASVRELLALGYTQLASTFLLGNESSMLWHWRHGFTLQSFPGLHRRIRQRGQNG